MSIFSRATRTLQFLTADVFTDRPFGGNQLAVVLDADDLDAAAMQAIAREFNFSETTFVTKATTSRAHCRVRIFTPAIELPFAGHPTIGTAWVLGALGRLPENGRAVFEEGVGPVPIEVEIKDGAPCRAQFTAARTPEGGPPLPDPATLAAMLNLKEADIFSAPVGPLSLSCGTPFACIPLRSVDAVARAYLDLPVWKQALSKHWAPNLYVIAPTSGGLHARSFGPAAGITEDPATGSAACAVTGWLVPHHGLRSGTGRWTIDQGVEMGRPSRINIEADVVDNKITAVRCGGTAVIVSEGRIRA